MRVGGSAMSVKGKKMREMTAEEKAALVSVGSAAIDESLLADEPTGNLDSATAARIFGLVDELVAKGLTLVVVTHNRELADQAHRVIRLSDGNILGEQGNS
ncbi:MAG: hypothetical protein ACM3X8_00525 [Methanomicrobiales archaeon]